MTKGLIMKDNMNLGHLESPSPSQTYCGLLFDDIPLYVTNDWIQVDCPNCRVLTKPSWAIEREDQEHD